MNDQTRLRLGRIAKPTAPRPPPAEGDERAAAFLAAFARVRDEVLRPAMAEVGLQLKKTGYNFRIRASGDERSPSIDFHVILADRGNSKDTVRFFAGNDAVQGWLVIGELELTGSPVELARFETTKEITHDVAEHLVVDAVEQMFAPAEAPRSRTPFPPPHAAIPAPAPPPLLDAPARLSIESLPIVKPSAPAVATEPPAFLASRRSPFAATSMALDLPIGPALSFAKSADETRSLSPPKPPSVGEAADTPSPLPTTLPRVNKAPAHLTGTVDLPKMPIGPALPFAQSPGPQPPLPSPASGGESGPTPAPALPRVNKAPAHLVGTVDLPKMPIGPALPFAESASQTPARLRSTPPVPMQDLAGTLPLPDAPSTDASTELRETSEVVDMRRGPVLPFSAAPDLNLEDYARFRARLTVKGENDAETLRYYGLPSPLVKEALQERFAIRFRQDPEAQRRFVELVQKFVAELRDQATKG